MFLEEFLLYGLFVGRTLLQSSSSSYPSWVNRELINKIICTYDKLKIKYLEIEFSFSNAY